MKGQIFTETGMPVNNESLQLVHIKLAAGEDVKPHDHKGQDIYFTVVGGEVVVTLDGEEQHKLTPGSVLNFAGEAMVAVHAEVDSEFFVYLINRR